MHLRLTHSTGIPAVLGTTMLLACGMIDRSWAEQRVQLEVVTVSGQNALAIHEWARMLNRLPFDSVRLLNRTGSASPSIESLGDHKSKLYRVTGVLSGGTLALPGGKFRRNEAGRIQQWLENIGQTTGIEPELYAFGLTAQQLVDVTDALAVTHTATTKDRKTRDVLREINRRIRPKITIHDSARDKITDRAKIAEELQSVSAGTAVAAILRPLGLVLVPEHRNGQTRLLIKDVHTADENWPIGWPREGDPGKLVPKWFDYLEVEIIEVPLAEALQVLQSRMEIPFLMDQNGMARQNIDPNAKLVSFPNKRTFYGRITRSLLQQAGLKSELRADEAGQPFLWIYPFRS